MTMTAEIALQLYSIRESAAHDLAGSLARVRAAGFAAIELYNFVEWKDDLAVELKRSGLTAPTAHARLTEGNQDQIFRAAADLGVETIIDPHVAADRWTNAEDVTQVAEELSLAAEKAAGYGLRFAYHNHFWEVENLIGGETALQYLLDRLPPDVSLEVDAYWAAIAGADVPQLLTALGDRVRFLHLKDAPLTGSGVLSKDRMDQLPVDEGSLNWDEILSAAPSAELYVVEFDEFRGDVFDAARRSHEALVARGAVS